MTDSFPSPFTTPKRKRTSSSTHSQDALPSSPPLNDQFSFAVGANKPSTGLSTSDSSIAPPSGSNSPRTKVAHHFRGLALGDHAVDSGSGTVADDEGDLGFGYDNAAAFGVPGDSMQVDEDESKMRKRTKTSPMPDASFATSSQLSGKPNQSEIPETPATEYSHQASRFALMSSGDGQQQQQQQQPNSAVPFVLDQALFTSSPKPSPAKLLRPYLPAASNRALEALRTGGKGRKRGATASLSTASNKTGSDNSAGRSSGAADPSVETDFVDPVRAALTWHEDEITVYDPEDEDDDGVGINGIGFKPTPAIAHARTMKRRQQLAEYKKREEREARARRSLRRRRGSPEPAQSGRPQLETVDSASRKVRFTETEPTVMIETV